MNETYFWLGEGGTRVAHCAPDHSVAAAAMLRRFAERLEAGESGYDLGPDLILCARMIARQI